MTYADKLKLPKWQKKRLKIMERDGWTCKECGDSERTLHVHHIKYIIGREPWDYPNSNFKTLCELCHAKKHQQELRQEITIKPHSPHISISETINYLAEWFNSYGKNASISERQSFILEYRRTTETVVIIKALSSIASDMTNELKCHPGQDRETEIMSNIMEVRKLILFLAKGTGITII